MPLGLVRLWTFRLSAWVSWVQTWVRVLACARGGRVIHSCQNKNPIERLTSGCGWCHAPEVRTRRIWGILKKSVSWVELSPASGEDGWLSLARGGLGQVPHMMGGRRKSPNRKNVYLSPYVEEPFHSKVIKNFVPELRNRNVFFEFRDSYVLCINVTNSSMNVFSIHVWLCYR